MAWLVIFQTSFLEVSLEGGAAGERLHVVQSCSIHAPIKVMIFGVQSSLFRKKAGLFCAKKMISCWGGDNCWNDFVIVPLETESSASNQLCVTWSSAEVRTPKSWTWVIEIYDYDICINNHQHISKCIKQPLLYNRPCLQCSHRRPKQQRKIWKTLSNGVGGSRWTPRPWSALNVRRLSWHHLGGCNKSDKSESDGFITEVIKWDPFWWEDQMYANVW